MKRHSARSPQPLLVPVMFSMIGAAKFRLICSRQMVPDDQSSMYSALLAW
jgi:hypothetical protein